MGKVKREFLILDAGDNRVICARLELDKDEDPEEHLSNMVSSLNNCFWMEIDDNTKVDI